MKEEPILNDQTVGLIKYNEIVILYVLQVEDSSTNFIWEFLQENR